MESDEDFFVEAQVDHLRNFFPGFPKSIVKDILNRPDINRDIDLASQALLTFSDMNELPEENEMVYVEYDDDEFESIEPDQQTTKNNQSWGEDDDYDGDDDCDGEVFAQRDELVEELSEKEMRPTKSYGNGTGKYSPVVSELSEVLGRRSSGDNMKLPKRRPVPEDSGKYAPAVVSELEQVLQRRSTGVSMKRPKERPVSEVLLTRDEKQHPESSRDFVQPAKVLSHGKSQHELSNEDSESEERPSHEKCETINTRTASSYIPSQTHLRPTKSLKMSSESSDEDIEGSLFSKYNTGNTDPDRRDPPTISQPMLVPRNTDSMAENSGLAKNAPRKFRRMPQKITAETKPSVAMEKQSHGVKHVALKKPEKSHEPPKVLAKPKHNKRQASKPTPQLVAPQLVAPQLEAPQSTPQLEAPQSTPQLEAPQSTPQLEDPQVTPQLETPQMTPQAPQLTPQLTNKQNAESKSDEYQPGNCGTFNANRILVSGLNNTTTCDALSNYMELMCDEDVVGVKFLGNGRAFVDTGGPVDIEKVKTKVSNRTLEEKQLKVGRIRSCDSVLVSGLPPQVTKDTVLLYFENGRRSGGGDVKGEVTLCKDTNRAVVCFEDPKVIENVISREHTMEGQKITVEKYYPQISPQILSQPCDIPPAPPNNATDPAKTKEKAQSESADDRLNVDCEVEPDIMKFIMKGKHQKELEKILNNYKAEIKWNSGSKSAKIWKKIDSGYVKKWSTVCKTAALDFLDQFEKFSMPIESILSNVIKNALPRLTKDLPKGKALCKVGDGKDTIIVVCLENDKDIVSDAVQKVLKIIEKEEIRKAYKKETVKIEENDQMLLLQKMTFLQEMREKHSDLEVHLDKEKRELYIEGPREQFTDFKIRYFQMMSSFTKRKFVFPSAKIWEIVCKEPGRTYLQEKLDRNKIKALIFVEGNNGVNIMAANSTAVKKAEDCLLDSMKQDEIKFNAQDSFIFQGEKYKKLLNDLPKSQLVNISIDTQGNKVTLQGMVDAVLNAKTELEKLMKSECVRDQSIPVQRGFLRLLSEHYLELLKSIESKQSRVSIEVDMLNEVITVNGTQDGLRKGKEHISDILAQFVKKKKTYSAPGVTGLLLGSNGKRNLKLIEMEKKSVIETEKKLKDGLRDTKQEEVDIIREEKEELREDSPRNSDVYDCCNFTTPTGIKVSSKHGHIENEKADALVNSATSDLRHHTACFKALASVGGPSFEQACKPHTNVPAGTVITTTAGNLNCKWVIHAIGCHWRHGKKGAEQILRSLVQNILAECVRLQVTSVALPAIGTGQHGFPEHLVATIYVEELKRFHVPGILNLKEVRIIIFKAGRRSTKKTPTALPVPVSIPSPANDPRVVSFGSVRVLLHEGDITQQPPAVDAIINPLDSSLKLSSGGGVNKVILNNGGPIIQQELDSPLVVKSKGSVFQTTAGNINSAQHILHFLPVSTDAQGLQSSIEACLNKAKSSRFSSVSVPAIGTAGFNIPPNDSADLIVKAAKNFSAYNYKLDVNIVVFQKQMITDFEAVFKMYPTPVPQVVSLPAQNVPKLVPQAQVKKSSLKSPRAFQQILRTGTAKEEVVLHVSASPQDIDTCIKEVDKFIEEHTTTKEINQEKAFDALVKHWPEVQRLARDHDVSISSDQSSSVVAIQGRVASVSDCKDKLSALITVHVEEERKSAQKEFISKNVQWYYFQGSQSVPYAKELNTAIEMTYMENTRLINIARGGVSCQIDVNAKTETNPQSGEILTISRKQMGESNAENDSISIPSNWAAQPSSQVVQLVSLPPASPEYVQVLNHFRAKGGTASQIIKIERVQNPGLYKAYLVKKQSMNGADNEMQLFHGTNNTNITQINANNFDRSFAGTNGVMYGNGVYFARDSSYSIRYSQHRNTGYCCIYVARVLVGKYTTGARGMKAPPSRNDPNNPGLLYDSLVDNPGNPSIFVIFLDHQCYPEYLITFQ